MLKKRVSKVIIAKKKNSSRPSLCGRYVIFKIVQDRKNLAAFNLFQIISHFYNVGHKDGVIHQLQ